jgi:hypothetical protein
MKRNNGYALLLIITLLGFLLFGCQIGNGKTNPGDLTSENQPAEDIIIDSRAGEIYEVGDIISIGNTILVVLGWDLYPGGSQFPPEEGYKHLAVDVMLANQGKDPFKFSPGWFMTLKDSSGKVYEMNGISGYVSGSDSPVAEIVPGEIIRGKIGFQVPEEQADFVFIYEPDQDDLGEISINLGSTPVFLDPPTDINLKFQQKIFLVGDSAEILNQIVQVIEVSYPADEEIARPKEGYKSIVVDLQFENQGDATLYFTGSDQIYLKDSTGQKYSSNSSALPEDSDYVVGSLQPGESIRGQIGFHVPEDAGGFIFVFDPDLFEFGKVFISLD